MSENDLSTEVLDLIMSFLPLHHRIRVGRVSKFFYSVSNFIREINFEDVEPDYLVKLLTPMTDSSDHLSNERKNQGCYMDFLLSRCSEFIHILDFSFLFPLSMQKTKYCFRFFSRILFVILSGLFFQIHTL
jgi:hypothetical protein